MVRSIRAALVLPTLFSTLLLVACGGGSGGGGNSSASSQANANAAVMAADPNAPAASGNTANDGFNWFNFRRVQMGLSVVVRNNRLDEAATGHSNYQALNEITHDQTPGRPGFTGVTLTDRLRRANYALPTNGYAIGEVISMTSDPSGYNAAEGLIAAIYHRFVAFEPMFKEAGSGAVRSDRGFTLFTTNFASTRLDTGLGAGTVATYPFPDQQLVPVNFFSDNEVPDPMPSVNEVGYPISVHADGIANIEVVTFTVRPRGGAALPVRLLSYATDREHTPRSAAAIIPTQVLSRSTAYDVQFVGTVDGVAISRNWSFTTR